MPRLSAFAAVLILAAGSAAAPPQLDPQPSTPYLWRVAVQFKPNALLPIALQQQIAREVKATLHAAVGELADVQVIDLAAVPAKDREPLWKAFAETGWAALDAPAARKITGVKTHFLTVDVRNGKYHLEARQHDGDTGLASPAVRTQETASAEKVGRVAGMILMRDFGPVATVEEYDPAEGTVAVRFRAGAAGPLERFVQPGDVLAVAAVVTPTRRAARTGEPAERDGKPREFTLIRLTEQTGVGAFRGRVLTRWRNPLPYSTGVAGFRAIKLATVEGPLAVKLVRPGSGEPIPVGGLIRVRAMDAEYTARPDPRDAFDLRDGVFRSPRAMRNAAVVVVGVGTVREEKFPVPVLGIGSPVTLPFEPSDADAARATFARACEELRARVADARLTQVALFDGVGKLIAEGKYQEALDRATKGLERLQQTDKSLTAEVGRLRSEPGATDPVAVGWLDSSDGLLQGLRLGEPALRAKIDDLHAAIEKSKDPTRFEREFRAKELMARIKQRLEQGDGTDALALYDQLIALTGGQADIKAAREKLEAEWTPKTEEQKAAREYVAGNEWRGASSVEQLKAALPNLQKAADALLAANDKYGLHGMLASLEPAYTRIKEQVDLLDGDSSADRPILTELQKVLSGLQEIETKAREKLKALDPPPAN